MRPYNAAEWLVDRHVAGGAGINLALRCQGQASTYESLQREVWRAQNALRDLGLGAGERIALALNDELAFFAWFLGALRSGIVAVPLSTMATGPELAAAVADAGARAIVLSGEYSGRLAAVASAAPTVEHRVVVGDPLEPPTVPVLLWSALADTTEAPVAPTTADSPAFWLYSSGTTGTPKGVMHRQGSLQATAETYAQHVLEIGSHDRCLSVAKLFFAYGLGNSLTFPLSVGGCAILNPARPTPAGVLDLIRAELPTLLFASPGFVAALLDLDAPPEALSSVRCTVTAGEALPAELQRRFAERFEHPLLDGIGTTEALHIFLSNTKEALRPGSSGMPVPGYEVKLIDDDSREVAAPDTPGYLHVRGPSIASGYWHRDEATAAAFADGWLRTGDVYVRTADGYWTFLGRNNDMIKAGGIWVSPAEVEATLAAHPDVLEAAVVGARNKDGLEEVVAFVVPRDGHRIDDGSIEAHCREQMAAFKRPRRIITVDALPRTATGKIMRFTLRGRLAGTG